MSEKQVYSLHEVAAILGMTESAFRGQLHRDRNRVEKAVPQPFRRIGKRLVWRKHDVDEWLSVDDPPEESPVKRPRGRPTKAAKISGLA